MNHRSVRTPFIAPLRRVSIVVVVATLLGSGLASVAVASHPSGESSGESENRADWEPPRLANGQPNLTGTWNNVGASHVPFELPPELRDQNLTREERQALLKKLSDAGKAQKWEGHENSSGVGAYANYWFDWYYEEPVAGEYPQLLLAPESGMPSYTQKAKKQIAFNEKHVHDSYDTMEAGDRCISRGIYGLMMPTAYNNGKMFFQTPDHLVILSEMIHNARIIPIDGGPHINDTIKQWEGDPRGHWEGDTLVVESTNFRHVDNMRGPPHFMARSPQTHARRVVERFTMKDGDTMRYELTVDDPETWEAPYTVTFDYKRDNEYQQYEYACHEGNLSVPNSLSGARMEEKTAQQKAAEGR